MKASALSLVLLFSLVLSGCSNDSAKTGAGGTTGKTADGKAAAEGPKLTKLEIKDVEIGDETTKPAASGDTVVMLYKGTLKDGSVFDQNMTIDKDPFAVQLGANQVIKGWEQGIPGMHVGGVRKLSIPADLAYGPREQEGIPANSDLYFEVHCLYIIRRGEEQVFDTTDKKVGTGPAVKPGDTIDIDYEGTFLNGRVFDSTKGKKPFEFKVGERNVVAGFDKGVQGMKVGGTRILILPPAVAYGMVERPGIPPNSVLKFEITLRKIK